MGQVDHSGHFHPISNRRPRGPGLGLILAVALTLTGLGLLPAPARAATIEQIAKVDGQLSLISVASPALGRTVVNQVLRPKDDGPAPVLYLLNGRSGGTDGDSWLKMTDYRTFFADKKVTVVSPVGGGYEYYSTGAWEQYLRHELPAALAEPLKTDGRAAIAGLSHTAPAALDLAGRSGGQYQAVAAYSGCPSISSPIGQVAVPATMAIGGGNAFDVFGPPGSPGWVEHDPSLHPERLAGKTVYLGAGSGIAGEADGPSPSLSLYAGPAQVEAVSLVCTQAMSTALTGAGVPHTFRTLPTGAHTWKLFEALLHDSWPVIGPAIGA